MSRRKWVNAFFKDNEEVKALSEEDKTKLGDEEIVLLLSGYNNFGDKIYNYLKLPLKQVEVLINSVDAGGRFDVRDFGEVVAAGMGNPPPEVREEIESQFKMISFPKQSDE